MHRLFSTTAIAFVLATSAVHSANARPSKSHVDRLDCTVRLMGSDEGNSRGACASATTARKHVRATRHTEVDGAHAARRGASCGGSLSTIRAASGATACVASRVASNFQGFVTALEATG